MGDIKKKRVIASCERTNAEVELPLSEYGQLHLEALQHHAIDAIGLKYKNPANGKYRYIVPDHDGYLLPPEDGWTGKDGDLEMEIRYGAPGENLSIIKVTESKVKIESDYQDSQKGSVANKKDDQAKSKKGIRPDIFSRMEFGVRDKEVKPKTDAFGKPRPKDLDDDDDFPLLYKKDNPFDTRTQASSSTDEDIKLTRNPFVKGLPPGVVPSPPRRSGFISGRDESPKEMQYLLSKPPLFSDSVRNWRESPTRTYTSTRGRSVPAERGRGNRRSGIDYRDTSRGNSNYRTYTQKTSYQRGNRGTGSYDFRSKSSYVRTDKFESPDRSSTTFSRRPTQSRKTEKVDAFGRPRVMDDDDSPAPIRKIDAFGKPRPIDEIDTPMNLFAAKSESAISISKPENQESDSEDGLSIIKKGTNRTIWAKPESSARSKDETKKKTKIDAFGKPRPIDDDDFPPPLVIGKKEPKQAKAKQLGKKSESSSESAIKFDAFGRPRPITDDEEPTFTNALKDVQSLPHSSSFSGETKAKTWASRSANSPLEYDASRMEPTTQLLSPKIAELMANFASMRVPYVQHLPHEAKASSSKNEESPLPLRGGADSVSFTEESKASFEMNQLTTICHPVVKVPARPRRAASAVGEDVAVKKVDGSEIPANLCNAWTEMDLDEKIVKNLVEVCGYPSPRKVQAIAIPLIQKEMTNPRDPEGPPLKDDVRLNTVNGSGKTAAYLIPIIDYVLKIKSDKERLQLVQKPSPYAIVLVHTHELVAQICEEGRKIATDVPVSVLTGDEGYNRRLYHYQHEAFADIDILIATPVQLKLFLRQRNILPHRVNFFVLDEADLPLQKANCLGSCIEEICRSPDFPRTDQRQTILASATFEEKLPKYADRYLVKPDYKTVVDKNMSSSLAHVTHNVVDVQDGHKGNRLLEVLKETIKDDQTTIKRTLIFVKVRNQVEPLVDFLRANGVTVAHLVSGMRIEDRDKAMRDFEEGRVEVLIASDVCSRGVIFKNLEHVINFDIPHDLNSLVHRVGRLGFAKSGLITTFYDPAQSTQNTEFLVEFLDRTNQMVPPFLQQQ